MFLILILICISIYSLSTSLVLDQHYDDGNDHYVRLYGIVTYNKKSVKGNSNSLHSSDMSS